MTRPEFKKEFKGKKEELKYPCSPRSQKWINNLLPVLESYNYNYADIVKLVKNCDYNAEKIQLEVEKIVEMKLGHEQGEWELVRPNSKDKSLTKTHGYVNSKFKGKKDDKFKKAGKFGGKEDEQEEDSNKELFTSWASILKRDTASSSSTKLLEEEDTENGKLLGESGDKNLLGEGKGLLGENKGLLADSKSLLTDNKSLLSENKNLLGEGKEEVKQHKPPVVMPKEFNYNDSKLTFGCLEDESFSKPWPDYRQKSRNVLQTQGFTNYYERKAMVYYDDPNVKKNFNPFTNNLQNPNLLNTGLNTNLPLSNNYSTTTNNNGSYSKENVYYNYQQQHYNNSNERLQNPPGLVNYYTPQQQYYNFNNNNSNTSMWQN